MDRGAPRRARDEPGLNAASDCPARTGCVLSGRRLTVFWVESDAEPVASAEIAEVRWTPVRNHPDDLAPMLEHHVLPVILSTITGS